MSPSISNHSTCVSDEDKQVAEGLIRRCVHCGFCNATCPTYQLLGDELDGPRGRIYLMKQVFDGGPVSRATQTHLDRCLTCRNCETTCPSGVEYGHLVDIGRRAVEAKVPRAWHERLHRWAIKKWLLTKTFEATVKVAGCFRAVLPTRLRAALPTASASVPLALRPPGTHEHKVLLLDGCAQPSMRPSIDAATRHVLDQLGIEAFAAPGSGCCGALSFHLNDQEDGLARMRRNVDAWWPWIAEGKVQALVMNASGCGAMVREYGHHLRKEPEYAERARRVSEMTRDLSEYLAPHAEALSLLAKPQARGRVTVQEPCSLQHWQGVRGVLPGLLTSFGFEVVPSREPHLCCGSAGPYSLLQPAMAGQLRARKLADVLASDPDCIASANVGCIVHLQQGTQTPVRHWVELISDALARRPG